MVDRSFTPTALFILLLGAACAPQAPVIPEGEIAVFAYKLDAFGAIDTVPTYTANLIPNSPILGALPDSLGPRPSWSPNGDWIATVDREGRTLIVLSTDSPRSIQIPTGLRGIAELQWYPTSPRITFSAADANDEVKIYTMDLSCLGPQGLCRPSAQELVEGRSPSISFDEQWIAYTRPNWDCGNLDLQCEAVFISQIQGQS
jgi:hypothetical protein